MKTNIEQRDKSGTIGVWYAVAAFFMWGILPIYWKSLHQIPAMEILAHRIFWSFIFIFFLVRLTGGMSQIREIFAHRSKWLPTLFASILISINWLIYIWAVNSNHIVEASLGYYINPLISIFLGMLVLRERLNFWQLLSLVLALCGVFLITVQFGKFPWVALSLALTFGLYGLVKKMMNFEAKISLFIETLFVMPIALIYIIFLQVKGIGSFGIASLQTDLLFIGGGMVTALPLLWFAQATKRVSLSTVGFIQYLSPSISLLIGILIYNETFTKSHIISFGFIWFALALYSFSQTRMMVNIQPKPFKASKYTNKTTGEL